MTEKRQLQAIRSPTVGNRGVLDYRGEGTVVLRGSGSTVWACAGCGTTILDGVEPAEVPDVLFRCGRCGTYNGTTGS